MYDGFNAKLLDLLAHAMAQQTAAGAQNMALFDTAAGEVDAATYRARIVPVLAELLRRFRALDAATPVTYYSRGTGPAHWEALEGLPIQCLGIDWNHDLAGMLVRYGDRWCIQGNVDPQWLHLPGEELERRLRAWFGKVRALPPERLRGWVCGLGHGVLQKTPEANVLRFLAVQREMFG